MSRLNRSAALALGLAAALGSATARLPAAASPGADQADPGQADRGRVGPHPLAAGPARSALEQYLGAIAAGRYGDAFGMLSSDERRYFESGANYASIFEADHYRLEHAEILSATSAPAGVLATVRERSRYVDPSDETVSEADGTVLYGLVPEAGGYRIKDPYHPWRAIAPQNIVTTVDGLSVTIRKISFFTGRIEIVVSLENRGAEAVTFLPNRTIVRDERGNVLHCIIDPAVPFTDRQIRLGLRLAANARYTGALAFASVDRYRPRSLALSLGPLLRDAADRPFSIDVQAVALAR